MILMSKYKGKHCGKKGQKIWARPSPTVPQEGDIFDCFRNAFFPVCMINLGYSTHVFSMGTFLFQLMSNTRTFEFFNGQKLSKM